MMQEKEFDVIIIGGSYAGLSAALALGRSRRKTLIIDSGLPCNRQTPHSHNFLTQDAETPAAIATIAREQVMKYDSIHFLEDLAVGGKKTSNGFVITSANSGEIKAGKLIFATGITDLLPDVPGFAACWGISIIHCPYCHGYEFRDQATAILANGEKAFHLATLVSNLTADITIFTMDQPDFGPDQLDKLRRHHIKVAPESIREVRHEKGQLREIILSNGDRRGFSAMYAALPFTQHSSIPADLGCELTEHGHVKIDAFQQTTIPGVYACGDNSAMMRSVANAVYAGNVAGAVVNKELCAESF